jgi:DNA-binding NarL/FixJ family response regulator
MKGRRPRLLIADDDALFRSLLWAQLQRDFDCVAVAVDAAHAVAIARDVHPDIVLLDVNMPCGGARRATPGIRECSRETAIVLLSSDESDDEVVELLNAGATAYLRKGIDRRTLVDKMLASIEAHRRWQSLVESV